MPSQSITPQPNITPGVTHPVSTPLAKATSRPLAKIVRELTVELNRSLIQAKIAKSSVAPATIFLTTGEKFNKSFGKIIALSSELQTLNLSSIKLILFQSEKIGQLKNLVSKVWGTVGENGTEGSSKVNLTAAGKIKILNKIIQQLQLMQIATKQL